MEGQRMEGIVGLTKSFRNEMIGLAEGSVIVFTGSSAVCAPFAELLAYSVRDKKFDIFFSPMANGKDCRAMVWNEGSGYCISSDGKQISGADAIVVFGGLAMPKFGCPVEDVKKFIEGISKADGTKVVGVGFMDILMRTGWHNSIRFDGLINANLETEKQI